jgi:2-dehydropantoate 2-reductase
MLGSWENGLRALGENGARLIAADGSEQAFPVQVTNDPAECIGARHALVLVKAWQTERAAKQLARCLATDGLTLTLQNGLGNRETLAHSLGRKRVAAGVTTTGATLLGPGLARIGGEGVVSLEAHTEIAPLRTALTRAGFNVQIVEDAEALLWGKLIVNAAINPLTALLHIQNGELLNRPAARTLMYKLAQEAAAVAVAQGVKLPFKDAVTAVEEVVRKTAANHSSMYQDVQRGVQTEIDAICGAITQAGEKAAIATPVNQVCWRLIHANRPVP